MLIDVGSFREGCVKGKLRGQKTCQPVLAGRNHLLIHSMVAIGVIHTMPWTRGLHLKGSPQKEGELLCFHRTTSVWTRSSIKSSKITLCIAANFAEKVLWFMFGLRIAKVGLKGEWPNTRPVRTCIAWFGLISEKARNGWSYQNRGRQIVKLSNSTVIRLM